MIVARRDGEEISRPNKVDDEADWEPDSNNTLLWHEINLSKKKDFILETHK